MVISPPLPPLPPPIPAPEFVAPLAEITPPLTVIFPALGEVIFPPIPAPFTPLELFVFASKVPVPFICPYTVSSFPSLTLIASKDILNVTLSQRIRFTLPLTTNSSRELSLVTFAFTTYQYSPFSSAVAVVPAPQTESFFVTTLYVPSAIVFSCIITLPFSSKVMFPSVS